MNPLGITVMQLMGPLVCSSRDPGSNMTRVLHVWSLHVLPTTLWVLLVTEWVWSRCSGFLAQHKGMQVRTLIGHYKLSLGVLTIMWWGYKNCRIGVNWCFFGVAWTWTKNPVQVQYLTMMLPLLFSKNTNSFWFLPGAIKLERFTGMK